MLTVQESKGKTVFRIRDPETQAIRPGAVIVIVGAICVGLYLMTTHPHAPVQKFVVVFTGDTDGVVEACG